MASRIAIQPDHIVFSDGTTESYSKRWAVTAAERGYETLNVDVRSCDIISQLEDVVGFMWRFTHQPFDRMVASRVLPVIEHYLGIPVFPDWNSSWHYDDKIAQKYLLDAAGIPTPKTTICWARAHAEEFFENCEFPVVWKLSSGASSEAVELIGDRETAQRVIDEMFTDGRFTPVQPWRPPEKWGMRRRVSQAGRLLLTGRSHRLQFPHDRTLELHSGYVYIQEFLPGNLFDTRVTVIGDRAFAFRRLVRDNDFRASGSGKIDWDVDAIDERFIRLAFRVAQTLRTQSVAIDGMYRHGETVVGEVSYGYAAWAVHRCPGHWRLEGDFDVGHLKWVPGHRWPQDVILDDFLIRVASPPNAVRTALRPTSPFSNEGRDP